MVRQLDEDQSFTRLRQVRATLLPPVAEADPNLEHKRG
jgi:hypothetical protein